MTMLLNDHYRCVKTNDYFVLEEVELLTRQTGLKVYIIILFLGD